ncbi:LysR family transcriptional regulator [Streptomyces hygroscopicus]|uniref:LysR family transcriptional regulator n=1 Tax=Streptomyces hygroscopicus TaxID=1912 RepID=UPI0006895CC7|nr:LysR family transcriptional regulator [Streptomyces hygroscopicus]
MLLRQLEYLVALARTRHFAKAAEECYVSQPALSGAIRKLEAEFGVPLVRRTRKYEGLTPEGERIVVWAKRILADREAMEEEVRTLRSGMTGQLRIGSVPTASTAVSLLTQAFCAENPLARVEVLADLQTVDIEARLRSYELDAAVTYRPGADGAGAFTFVPLYRERFVLLTQEAADGRQRQEASWEEAGRQPLCLLHPRMFGRRTLDAVFARTGTPVRPRVETDSVASLFAHVRTGHWASVVPHAWLHVFGVPVGMRALPLVRPVHTEQIGLLVLRREPASVAAQAVVAAAGRADMAAALERVPGAAATEFIERPTAH